VSQEVQFALWPKQLMQVELQFRHTLGFELGSSNFPMVHAREHSPVDSRVASGAHEVQLVASPLEHVAQEASHATQASPPTSAYLPAGQSATQVPLS